MKKDIEDTYDLRDLYHDFKEFRLDMKEYLQENFDKLQNKLEKRLDIFTYWAIGLFTVFSLGFFYLVNEVRSYQESRMENLENVFYGILTEKFVAIDVNTGKRVDPYAQQMDSQDAKQIDPQIETQNRLRLKNRKKSKIKTK